MRRRPRYRWRSEHREALLQRWEIYRTLYSPSEIEEMTLDVHREVGRKLGGWALLPKSAALFDEWQAGSLDEEAQAFADHDGLHLQEIGVILGVTRKRVRQVIEIGLRNLRHRARLKRLEPVWDAVAAYRYSGSYEDALIAMIDSKYREAA